jgi:hypothetical protein
MPFAAVPPCPSRRCRHALRGGAAMPFVDGPWAAISVPAPVGGSMVSSKPPEVCANTSEIGRCKGSSPGSRPAQTAQPAKGPARACVAASSFLRDPALVLEHRRPKGIA